MFGAIFYWNQLINSVINLTLCTECVNSRLFIAISLVQDNTKRRKRKVRIEVPDIILKVLRVRILTCVQSAHFSRNMWSYYLDLATHAAKCWILILEPFCIAMCAVKYWLQNMMATWYTPIYTIKRIILYSTICMVWVLI